MCVNDRAGLGYNPLKKQKLYKNIFVKTSPPIASHLTCTYCNNSGHTSYSCKVRKCARRGVKTIWVSKKIEVNTLRPNKTWVTKANS